MRKAYLFVLLLLAVPSVSAITTPVRDVMVARQEVRKEIRAEVKEAFDKRKGELASRAAAMRERFKTRREEFQTKLNELKDKRKEAIAERVDKRIDELNKKHTERLAKALEQMSDILGRLEDKVASASSEGKNTASASAAIETAKTAVSAAQTAVSDQSAKDYAPDITDETTLRQVFTQAFSTFKSDMLAVHKQVQDAKQAVRTAAVAVHQLQVEVTPTNGAQSEQ